MSGELDDVRLVTALGLGAAAAAFALEPETWPVFRAYLDSIPALLGVHDPFPADREFTATMLEDLRHLLHHAITMAAER